MEFSPAVADCGSREPLAPRLARPGIAEDTSEVLLFSRPWAHSSAGERPLHTREVAGSIPAAPTWKVPGNRPFLLGTNGLSGKYSATCNHSATVSPLGHTGCMERAERACAVMGPDTRPPEPNRRHGARSRNPLPYDEWAVEIEQELLALPHINGIDAPACREISKLMSLIERVDVALSDGREVRSRPPSDRHAPLLVARVAGVAAGDRRNPWRVRPGRARWRRSAGSPVPRQRTLDME